MGELEKVVREEIQRSKINKAIISTLAVGGVMTLAVLAPNVLGTLRIFGVATPQKKQNIKRSFSKLVERGYVMVKDGRVHLTPKGERFAALLGEGRLAPKKPRRWDQKWRILIFDIPEHRRATRDKVRSTLLNLGFYRLQDSVWTYPYDCEDLITVLKVDLRIGKDLLYIIANKVEAESSIRQHFHL